LKQLSIEFVRFIIHILIKFLNKFVAVYFNNVIIYSKKVEEYNKHIQAIITKLIKTGLTLKIKKCEFDTTTVNYLGIVYTPEGLKIQLEKTDAILN
jgi:ABC-type branched-subunit amino acid transport system substrate-binding protein